MWWICVKSDENKRRTVPTLNHRIGARSGYISLFLLNSARASSRFSFVKERTNLNTSLLFGFVDAIISLPPSFQFNSKVVVLHFVVQESFPKIIQAFGFFRFCVHRDTKRERDASPSLSDNLQYQRFWSSCKSKTCGLEWEQEV